MHGEPPERREDATRKNMVKLTDAQKVELEALEKLSDDEIDLSDIPEMTDAEWSKAKRGMFYKARLAGHNPQDGSERRRLVRRTGRNSRRSPPEHQPSPRGTHEKGEVPGRKDDQGSRRLGTNTREGRPFRCPPTPANRGSRAGSAPCSRNQAGSMGTTRTTTPPGAWT